MRQEGPQGKSSTGFLEQMDRPRLASPARLPSTLGLQSQRPHCRQVLAGKGQGPISGQTSLTHVQNDPEAQPGL